MNSTKKNQAVLFFLSLCLLCFGTSWAQEKTKDAKKEASAKKEGAEKKLQVKDLPKAVQKTVEEQTKGATIRGLSKEVENGKTQYELETKVGSHNRDLIIDTTGKVLVVEEEIEIASLPAAMQAEVKKSLGAGKLVIIESVTKDGKPAGYEAVVERAGKKVSVEIGNDGKVPTKAKK